VAATIQQLQQEMLEASEKLEYEKAALLRDQIRELQSMSGEPDSRSKPETVSYRKGKRKKIQK